MWSKSNFQNERKKKNSIFSFDFFFFLFLPTLRITHSLHYPAAAPLSPPTFTPHSTPSSHHHKPSFLPIFLAFFSQSGTFSLIFFFSQNIIIIIITTGSPPQQHCYRFLFCTSFEREREGRNVRSLCTCLCDADAAM